MRKLRPSNYWNIGKIESWLSDMALEGYFLQTMDINFCDFKEDEPKEISYRIEIAENGKHLSQDQCLKYQEDLWTNVTKYNKFYVFSCPSELVNLEPNPSPEALGKSLKPLLYKNLLTIFVLLLGPILILRFLPYLSSTIVISMLRDTTINLIPYALLIWFILSLSMEALYQINLIRKLSKGISIDHHTPWKKTYWISSVAWNTKILLIAGIILSPILLYNILSPGLDSHPLSTEADSVPVVRLEAVEKADGSDFDETLLEEGYYYEGSNTLAKKQFNSSENTNTSADYYGAIHNEYFKLTFPSTQKLIVNSFVDRYAKFYKELNSSGTKFFKTESVENEYVDYLVYGSDSNTSNQHIFAAKDGVVLHIRYLGGKGKSELIKAVVEFFNNKVNET